MEDARFPRRHATYSDPVAFVVRMLWMMAGNVAILVSVLLVVRYRLPFPSWADAVLVAVLAMIVVARYVDIRRFGGQTASGAPATMRTWATHAVGLVAASALLRAGAHFLAAWVYAGAG